ncbi:MAG: pyrroline-5-carboxylate reductase [Actinobacteria bacterium]|nr:pyrroline-5-carboxylate reductase [Actinomycetota bacterium]
MKYRLGIIGCGNMGQAILDGMLRSSFLKPGNLIFFEKDKNKAGGISGRYGLKQAADIVHISRTCRYILIAVKPHDIEEVLDILSAGIDPRKTSILSIAAGISTEYIIKKLNKSISVVRIMPNMPAVYCCGMSSISRGIYASEEDMGFVEGMMGSIGEYVIIDEELQDISTALNGSGPAYFFLFCKYMIEAGVKNGLKLETAKKIVIKTMIGAGITMEQSGYGIDKLIDMVASPGGTTERALAGFREGQLKSIVYDAVERARNRACELEKKLD